MKKIFYKKLLKNRKKVANEIDKLMYRYNQRKTNYKKSIGF